MMNLLFFFVLFFPFFAAGLFSISASTLSERHFFILTLLVPSLIFLFLLNLPLKQTELIASWSYWEFSWKIDEAGRIFALLSVFLWGVTHLYSDGYMKFVSLQKKGVFYGCFSLSIGAVMHCAFASNLLMLFFFYELLTISTYPLVIFNADKASFAAGKRYLLYLTGSSMLFLLPFVALFSSKIGHSHFHKEGVMQVFSSLEITLLSFLFLYGVAKTALVPVHRWLPAAMVAPIPISALLHAVAVVNTGLFVFYRGALGLFGRETIEASIFGKSGWIFCASVTLFYSTWKAFKEDNLKARLAYSTINQLAYMLLVLAFFAPLSEKAFLIHMAGHSFAKITLFFAAGCYQKMQNKTKMSELWGIATSMPYSSIFFTLGALSLVGFPFSLCFLSKTLFSKSMMAPFLSPSYILILCVTLGSVLYLFPILFVMWKKTPLCFLKNTRYEAPMPMLIATAITAFGNILLYLWMAE